jgi:FeS assembly SUF system protein
MGIRDRIKNKARKAFNKATGNPESRRPTPPPRVKTWASYTPTGPEGHEAEESEKGLNEVSSVIGFSDTASAKDSDAKGEIPEHLVKALADAEKTDEVIKVDTDRLSSLKGEAGEIQMRVVDALRTVFDPEIPVNIYDLGLIYDVRVDEKGVVDIDMSLTSPNCPAAQSLPAEAKAKAEGTDGVNGASVEVIWEPAWGPELMSEEAKLELNVL